MALTQVSTGGIKDGQVHTADLADAQITAGKLHADALDRTYTLGASGTDHYTFTGEGLTGAVNDPTLHLTRGKTYRFVNGNSAGAHPFRIQTTVNGSAGTEYNTGVTNNGGAGGSTIVFEVPHAAPDRLYYQCTSHGSMGGILYITGGIADGSITNPMIADDAINSEHYANLSINNAHLNTNSVTTPKIEDANVTTAKIADEAVTLAKLPHGDGSSDGKFLRANNGADPTFESLPASGVTVSNNVNNRVATGDGTNLNAEANLTFDGTTLNLPNVNQFITGGGHNVFQVDATKTYFYGGTGGVQFRTADNSAEIASIDNSGNLKVKDADIIIGTTGHGINFDTAGSGSDQLLDDYEEGTWSPGINTGTANFSGSNYTKIGRMVTATTFVAQMSPRTSSSGIQITNLPYSCNGVHIASIGLHRVIGDQGNGYFGYVSAGVNFIDLLQYPWSQQGWKALPHTAIQHATAAYIIVTITYSTS